MLSKKDYIAIAKILNEKRKAFKPNLIEVNALDVIVFGLIDFFKSDNPKFDEDKFKSAILKD